MFKITTKDGIHFGKTTRSCLEILAAEFKFEFHVVGNGFIMVMLDADEFFETVGILSFD